MNMKRKMKMKVLLLLVVLLLSGCVTMTAGQCKEQCDSKGMVMKGIVSTPTTATRWAHDECMCEMKEGGRK